MTPKEFCETQLGIPYKGPKKKRKKRSTTRYVTEEEKARMLANKFNNKMRELRGQPPIVYIPQILTIKNKFNTRRKKTSELMCHLVFLFRLTQLATVRELAHLFKVSEATIYGMLRGESYQDIYMRYPTTLQNNKKENNNGNEN